MLPEARKNFPYSSPVVSIPIVYEREDNSGSSTTGEHAEEALLTLHTALEAGIENLRIPRRVFLKSTCETAVLVFRMLLAFSKSTCKVSFQNDIHVSLAEIS